MATLSILQASRSDKFEAVHLHGTWGTKHSTTRVITFSMSSSWLSPPSLGLLFLPLPLSLASMEPHRSAGDTGRWRGPSDVLAGALMMRRLLVYMMILPKSNTEDWRTQIMFFLKFDFPSDWCNNIRDWDQIQECGQKQSQEFFKRHQHCFTKSLYQAIKTNVKKKITRMSSRKTSDSLCHNDPKLNPKGRVLISMINLCLGHKGHSEDNPMKMPPPKPLPDNCGVSCLQSVFHFNCWTICTEQQFN